MHSKSLVTTLIALFSYLPSNAVTLNGQEVSAYGKPGEPIVYRDKQATNITIRIRHGDISIRSISIPKMQIDDIVDYYIDIEKHKDALSRNISKHALTTSSQQNIYAYGTYMASDTAIILQTNSSLDIKESLFKSPEVVLISNSIRLEKCFIGTKWLQIEPTNPDSIISMIIFVFDEKTPIPAYAQGFIDFSKDETIQDLVVLGAQEVGIVFKPKAYAPKHSH
jgi:hypothetical protein